MKRTIAVLCILAVISALGCGTNETSQPMLSKRGSLGFWFYVDQDYYNGVEPQGDLVTLVEAPDILHVLLDAPSVDAAAAQAEFGAKEKTQEQAAKKPPSSVVNLEWEWKMENGNRLNLYLPLLPGSAWYHLAYRWDSENGKFDGFLNGIPLRVPGTSVQQWVINEQPIALTTADNVEDLEITGDFWSEDDIRARAEKRTSVDVADLCGYGGTPPMEDIEKLKGTLLFAPDFSKAHVFDDWRMEGPGAFETDSEGWLNMESTEIDVGGPGDGHFVFWTPGVYPENFIMEWDFQPISDKGLCIILFGAMGQNGKDVFDSSLKERDGHFAGYIRGDINCYHISYFADIPTNPGRITSNLRKNYGFYLVSNGPPAVPGGSKDIHKVALMKNKGVITLGVDGRTIIDWTDDGRKYGPVHGKGSIALRQMKWMKARYRNLKIWEVRG